MLYYSLPAAGATICLMTTCSARPVHKHFAHCLLMAFAMQMGSVHASPPSQPALRTSASGPGHVQAPVKTQPQFKPTFYDPDLPLSAYQANEPTKIHDWLTRMLSEVPGKPDQFSTAEERSQYESSVARRVKEVGQIAVNGNCKKTYNSDKQAYEVSVLARSIKNYQNIKDLDAESRNLKSLRLATENIRRESYTAQNAYGAETQVSKTSADIYALVFPFKDSPTSIAKENPDKPQNIRLPYEYNFNLFIFNVAMSSAEARANDKDIGCMYVFSIAPPYLLSFTEKERPTRELPFEIIHTHYAFYGALEKVAVINRATGRIYEQADR